MAYAAYREYTGAMRVPTTLSFHVLDITISCADAQRVRAAVAGCPGAGVVRCEPLLHERNSQETDALRVRLMIRLPLASYARMLHGLIEAVPAGEIGRLVSWRDHLHRCGLRDGNEADDAQSKEARPRAMPRTQSDALAQTH